VNRGVQVVLLVIFFASSLAQTSQAPDLIATEKDVGNQFNELREKSGLKPRRARRDLRGCEWKPVLSKS